MNYTENYHLPQWVKSDRIMMEDFNGAMANIENGLTNTAGGVKSGLDRFSRLAYNHYCTVQDMKTKPCQTGVFYRDVTKNPSDVTGAMTWQGACFAGKTDVKLTAEMLVECYQELSPMRLTKGYLGLATPMTAHFDPPASGAVGTYSLVGEYSKKTSSATVLKLELTMTNRDNGSVEQQFVIDFPVTQDNGGFGWLCGTQIKFTGGVHYLITIRPMDDICDMTLRLSIGGRSVSTVSNDGILSASYAIHEPEGGLGGMAAVRCMVTGERGKMTFSWDGAELQPAAVRPAKLSDGRIVQDYIFLREDDVPVDSTLSLHFACHTGGNFLFYGWGAMLF